VKESRSRRRWNFLEALLRDVCINASLPFVISIYGRDCNGKTKTLAFWSAWNASIDAQLVRMSSTIWSVERFPTRKKTNFGGYPKTRLR